MVHSATMSKYLPLLPEASSRSSQLTYFLSREMTVIVVKTDRVLIK